MNPAIIDNMSWAMAEVYAAVTDRILINLAHHFPYVQTDRHIGSWEYQTKMLAQMGKVEKETIAIIAQSLGGADEALKQALETAILEGLKNEEPKLRQAAMAGLLNGGVPQLAPSQMQAFTYYYRQSADKFNLVNTVMLESTKAVYQGTVADVVRQLNKTEGILNAAAGEVITGVSTYNTAVHSAVQKMVKNGLTGFIDHGGHKWTPEAYVAMDVKTTMFNTARQATWERQEQYGSDLYQVSSHNGARPLCYPWQGKVISTSGRTGTTFDIDGNEVIIHSQDEIESFRYGGGLFGVNCGHYPMTFIPNFSSLKGEPQDPDENAKTYAESQQQRALERNLREQKRDLEVMKAQGASPEEINAQKERVRSASADIDEFCDKTGRARKRSREQAPVRAEWSTDNGNVTRYNGGYIGTKDVPPPKGVVQNVPKPQPTPQPAPVVAQQPVPTPPVFKTKIVTTDLPNSGIQKLDYQKWSHTPTRAEIIASIGGADQTTGSCASVSLAYVGNRAGYDVHDYRGGKSCNFFATKTNTLQLCNLPEVGGTVIVSAQEIKTANQLLATMEEGKEYWLGIGRHASIVRVQNGAYEYLELQSDYGNGWHSLNDSVLRYRFGCVKKRGYAMPARLMDVEKLGQSDDFLEALKYINTNVADRERVLAVALSDYTFYKMEDGFQIWWVDTPCETDGEMLFTFDKKRIYNFFADYPHELTPEQIAIFKRENPILAQLKEGSK